MANSHAFDLEKSTRGQARNKNGSTRRIRATREELGIDLIELRKFYRKDL